MLEWIGAVRPVGVHHRGGGRQLGLALVVVRHHHVHAQRGGEGHLLVAGDAAVHGDHQRGPLVAQGLDGVAAEAVAVLHPAGDIAQAPGAAAAQVVHQQHRGGDAVHVVVAEHGDGLPLVEGPLDPVHGLAHVPHQHGGQGQAPLPLQGLGGVLRRHHAPGRQHGGEQIGVSGGAQPLHIPLRRGADVPLFEFHGRPPPFCGRTAIISHNN